MVRLPAGGSGGSGTGFTVSGSWVVVNRLVAGSVTVTVTVADPVRPAAGVTVSDRTPPAPPNTSPPGGTSCGSDEVAVYTSPAASVPRGKVVTVNPTVADPPVVTLVAGSGLTTGCLGVGGCGAPTRTLITGGWRT